VETGLKSTSNKVSP